MFSGYLDVCFINKRRKAVIKEAKRRLKNVQFDAVAVRGVSGMAMGFSIADALGKDIVVVRKGENRHSYFNVEYPERVKTYVIVDDFIDGGSTVRAITEAMPDRKCVGIYLYKTEKRLQLSPREWTEGIPFLNRDFGKVKPKIDWSMNDQNPA